MARITRSSTLPDARNPTVGLGRRILRARIELASQTDSKVSQAHLGLLVGRYLGAERGITGATVSRWEAEESAPDLVTLGAVAAVCRVDPGWLAFGSRSEALGPDATTASADVDEWKRARIALLLSNERQAEVAQWQKRVGREWEIRFNRNQRNRKAARRIKKDAERTERLAELDQEFDDLVRDLTRLTEEATEKYRVAMDLPVTNSE